MSYSKLVFHLTVKNVQKRSKVTSDFLATEK
jgi:hypothetical protein